MKQLLRYSCFVVLACLVTGVAQSRTRNIDVNAIKGDLTLALRSIGEETKSRNNDTIELVFKKGSYTINGTIQFWCPVVIRGDGSKQTTIILDNGKDKAGVKAFSDDAFFSIRGSLNQPVTASISDITFKLKDHKGIWWNDAEKYAVKIYHANHVDIHHVESYMSNAQITNFDLRVCSNVSVTDCILSNYNNCQIGGNLWIRGEMHNIVVKRNKFYKYGKDEALGFFDRVVDCTKGYVRGKANRTDIFIEDNEFYYGYNGKDKDPEAYNHTILTLMTDHKKSKDACTTRNFHLSGNTFHMTDETARCLYICFDPADVHEGIHIENNQIINEAFTSNKKYYRQDIEVNDLSSCGDTIHITGNTVRNKKLVINPSGSQGYSFLLVQSGLVNMTGNKIINEVVKDLSTGKSTGVQVIWAGAPGGHVTMRDNVCKGVLCIAYVGAGSGTQLFSLYAINNYFEGDTRVYSHKVNELHLNFTNNTFVSNNMNFFLQEFAPKGSVVFNNNNVTVTQGSGQFMTHWSKNSTHDYRFERLEVKNNVFRGVKNEREMFKNITNVGKRSVRNNTITQ